MSDALSEVKKRAAARWLKLPGVNAVGIGCKKRDGLRVGGLAIKVYVTEKKPLDAIPSDEVIPSEIEGVATDVDVLGLVADTVRPPGIVLFQDSYVDDEERYRPLKGGSRIQAKLSRASSGTLGCFLTDPSNPANVYALTAYHVFAKYTNGLSRATEIGQPSKKDSITKCCSHLFGNYASPNPANRPIAADRETVLPNPTFAHDAALARLEAGTRWSADILEIGPPSGIHTVTQDDVGGLYHVVKRGSTTGLTGGTVESIETVCTATSGEFMLIDANEVPEAESDTESDTDLPPVFAFSEPGDSGSAVVDEQGRVVGLLKGECPTTILGLLTQTKAIVIPIADVLNEFRDKEGLDLQVATATRPGIENRVPSAAGTRVRDSARPAAIVENKADLRTSMGAGLASLENDLDRSRRGRTIISVWLEHQTELTELVNNKRPVTVAWHRNGGAELVQSLLRAVEVPGHPIPHRIGGKPLAEALRAVRTAFVEYGSPELGNAFVALEAALPEIRSMTYAEFLDEVMDETTDSPPQTGSRDGHDHLQPRA